MENYAALFGRSLMKRYPAAEEYPFSSWCYSKGFYLWGMIKLYERSGENEWKDYVLAYCSEHVSDDGQIKGYTGISLDDVMTASVLVWACTVTGEARYQKACQRVWEDLRTYPRNPDGGFWHSKTLKGEMWVDGLFMGLMFVTRYGKYIGDTEECYDETVRQLNTVFARCRKDNTGLLYHAYSEGSCAPWASPVTGCSPEVWSEGLGWYAMILAEVLELLPADYPGRESLAEQYRLLCRDLLIVQDPANGLWYQVVDKPHADGNFHDTSGSAMFVYTLQKGIDLGILQGEEWKQAVQTGIRGILSKCFVGMDGEIHVMDACDGLGVQLSYDAYVKFAKTVDAKEAVAAVLWALGEV